MSPTDIKRIDRLTPEQKARMPEWRDRWIEIGLSTAPADRARFESAVNRCYVAAGLKPPRRLVWVNSPLVLAIAAPVAALILKLRQLPQPTRVAVRDAVDVAVGDAVRDAVDVAVGDAVGGAVGDAVGVAVGGAVRVAVGDAVGDAVRVAVGDAVRGAVRDAVRDAVDGAVRVAVGDAVDDAVRGAVDGAVGGTVGDAVGGAVGGAVRVAVRVAVGDAVDVAVGDAVGDAVDGAVDVAVDVAVGDAVDGAVRVAVGDAVGDAVRVAVGDAVGDAVRVAVRVATTTTAIIRRAVADSISRAWHLGIGGQFGVGGWYWGSPSYVSFFREVCGLDLGVEMNERAQAYGETASSACWWWPHREFVMVCERPRVIDRDQAGRLHRESGAAVEFRDGWGVHAWHGVLVTADIIEHPEAITVAQIAACTNAEIRRVMIERYGQARYLVDAGAEEISRDECGILYRMELEDDEALVMVRVLNATPEANGTLTRAEAAALFPAAAVVVAEFATPKNLLAKLRDAVGLPSNTRFKEYFLRVPPEMRSAREAVAWTFDLSPEQYDPAVQT